MKSKLINFIAAMGIPVSSITTQGAGCTGICGSCSLNCTPGIVALLLLAGKAFYKRYHGEVMQHGFLQKPEYLYSVFIYSSGQSQEDFNRP